MITIEQEKLLAALKKVLPGIDAGTTVVTGATQVLFTGKAVCSYNGTTSVTTPLDTQDLAFSVKGMDLYNLLSKFNEQNVDLEISGNKLKLKSGRTRASLTTLDGTSLQANVDALALNEVEFKPLPDTFVTGLAMCKFNNPKKELDGMAVGDYKDASAIFATDTNRICIYELPEKMDDFWIGSSAINNITKLGTPKAYCVSGAWLHVKYDEDTVLSVTRVSGTKFKYPVPQCTANMEVALKSEPILEGTLPENIKDVVARVSVLASCVNNTSNIVKMSFNAEGIELYAENNDGSATESVSWGTAPEGEFPPTDIWVDKAFLLEATNTLIRFSLSKVGNMTVMLFRTEGYSQLVATMQR